MNAPVIIGLLGIGAAVVILSRLGGPSKKDRETPLGNKILLLGDSITGTPAYAATLRKALPAYQVRVASFPGDGIKAVREKGFKIIRDFNPDFVVVLAGVNDLASGRGVEYVTAQLDQTYREIFEVGMHVVAVELTPWSGKLGEEHADELRLVNSYIHNHPIPYAHVSTATVRGQGKDGLHLTPTGAKLLAAAVAEQGRLA